MKKAITSMRLSPSQPVREKDGFMRFDVEEWFYKAPGFLSGPIPVVPMEGVFEAKSLSNGEFELVSIT